MDDVSPDHRHVHQSQIEMGVPVHDRGPESEDTALISSMDSAYKNGEVKSAMRGAFVNACNSWTFGTMRNRILRSIYIVTLQNKINLLLPFGPAAAIIAHIWEDKNGWVFFFSLLGITPLAERLGFVTEQLAFFTGPTVGGLLNATFGNATEMIISIYALRNDMIRVVQQSLLGSILSNMLLVLGCAFFMGGCIHYKKEQRFNKATAVVNSGLLLMAVMGLLFPAVLHFTHTELHFGRSELALSRFSSCVMLSAYAFYLIFQLKSHRNLYDPIDNENEHQTHENVDEEEAVITHWEAIAWLAILTTWISFLSGYLVNAIEVYPRLGLLHACQ